MEYLFTFDIFFVMNIFSLTRKSRSDVVSVTKLVSNRVEKHSAGHNNLYSDNSFCCNHLQYTIKCYTNKNTTMYALNYILLFV